MCSIIGSKTRSSLIELIKLNQFRGNFSYSLTLYNIKQNKVVKQIKNFGEFDFKIIPEIDHCDIYYIAHVQSPTGGLIKDENRIHPSIIKNNMLWHNGILKESEILRLKEKFKSDLTWDTALLHKYIYESGLQDLSNIDGSFGCIYLTDSINMFTTDTINLYMNDKLSISSVKFHNSMRIPPNTVFSINFKKNALVIITTFSSKSNPYYITDDENNQEENN